MFSETDNFTIRDGLVPKPIFPRDPISSSIPKFVWSKIAYLVRYASTVTVACESSPIICDTVEDTTFTAVKQNAPAEYYWKESPAGGTQLCSQIDSFLTFDAVSSMSGTEWIREQSPRRFTSEVLHLLLEALPKI
jgi:hypothetical protein